MILHLQNLIDDAKCFETVRQLRWPEGGVCPRCGAGDVTKQGRDVTHTGATTVSLPGVSDEVRRPDRHRLLRSSLTVAALDPLPVLHGIESFK